MDDARRNKRIARRAKRIRRLLRPTVRLRTTPGIPPRPDFPSSIPRTLKPKASDRAPMANMVPTPPVATVEEDDIPEDVFATLPDFPSVTGFSARLAEIQSSIEQARHDAELLRTEIQKKAAQLRALAAALEAAI